MQTERPYTVVSADTHVGPLLKAQLREYCPKRYLERFDEYVTENRQYREELRRIVPHFYEDGADGSPVRRFHNMQTLGHHDVHARLLDMNADGVAGEVIFHGSINDEPIPFTDMGDARDIQVLKNRPPRDLELAAIGKHIYNAWLADFCSVEPERHVGLAQIPVWDVEASVAEVEWAKEHGLKGVNFPAPQSWLPEYNKAQWEPLWAVAEALAMPLVTHFGAASDADYSGVDGLAIQSFENAVIFGKRVLPWMIYSGVFARHPGLKFVITEVAGYWMPSTIESLDSIYHLHNNLPQDTSVGTESADRRRLSDYCPSLPSEYFGANIFQGASFMNHFEAESASIDGIYRNILWGSDYPHPEGTFHYRREMVGTPLTHVAIQFACNGLPEAHVRAMLGGNAIKVFGMDAERLDIVADRIKSPTPAQILAPIELEFALQSQAEQVSSLAFRHHALFH
jgi:predicted TIM-barrel fold metal-dependent hydrolase